jgi:hypothetical protein
MNLYTHPEQQERDTANRSVTQPPPTLPQSTDPSKIALDKNVCISRMPILNNGYSDTAALIQRKDLHLAD